MKTALALTSVVALTALPIAANAVDFKDARIQGGVGPDLYALNTSVGTFDLPFGTNLRIGGGHLEQTGGTEDTYFTAEVERFIFDSQSSLGQLRLSARGGGLLSTQIDANARTGPSGGFDVDFFPNLPFVRGVGINVSAGGVMPVFGEDAYYTIFAGLTYGRKLR